jgi:cell wall-associated NlpC family hydrolase
MNWKDYYKRWADRAGSTGKLDAGVTFVNEQWEVPGEAPLTVRFCTREGHPMKSFARMTGTPKHSITLHHTSGYGSFNSLMGDRQGSAHFMIGRDGNAYRIVDTEVVAWHANMWSWNSIGIEVDNIGNLKLKGDTFYDEYGGAYCKKSDEGVWVEKDWPNYGTYWATWSDEQYVVIGRLLKALCHKHDIPKMILPEPQRYKGFNEAQQKKFRGICVHVNVKPDNRDDLGPYVDWARLIRLAGLTEGDCFGLGPPAPEADKPPPRNAPSEPKKSPPPPAPAPPKKKDAQPTPMQQQELAPPQIVDAHTVRVSVGARPGRIALTIKTVGEELKPAPKGEAPEAPKEAEGKRDKFIAAALSFKGTPYLAGSDGPAKGGLDGPGLIALCLKKVDVKVEHDPDSSLDAQALAAHFPPIGGTPDNPPEEILPGDIAWFGEGDHDHPATQHAMIWLGGGKLLGPVPGTKHEFHGAIAVIAMSDVGEPFAGFSHIEELGKKVAGGAAHHDEEPPSGQSVTAALLPSDPDNLYAALQGVVKDAGGKWESDADKVNLIGVTNLAELCQVSPKPGGWNDTLFAAWVDSDGHKHVIEVRASLDPAHDADPAGAWHLLEGAYKFKLEKDALVPDGKVRGWQDEKGKAAKPTPEPPPPTAKGDMAVSPKLRGLAQYDVRWNAEDGSTPLRGEPSPNSKPLPKDQSWRANACHCTSVAMVFRWIEDKTKGAFKFPTKESSEVPEDQHTRRLMEYFWPDLGGRIPKKGSEKGDKEGKIPHHTLRKLAEEALGMEPGSCRKVSLSGGLEKRLASLKKALAKGPVVLLMPGHYVVVQAIIGDYLYIVDPGNVLVAYWKLEDGSPIPKKQLMPDASVWPGGKLPTDSSDLNAKMYVKVPVRGKIVHDEDNKSGTFIELLDDAESYWWAAGGG